MKKWILLILTIILIWISFLSALAQKKSQAKTQRVKIYLYREVYEQTRVPALISVKRRVNARAPLKETILALLKGATPSEHKNDMNSFIRGVKLESVRVKNKTARVDFKYEEKSLSRVDTLMEILFAQAVEDTALQFKEIKRVLICVDGIENFFLSKNFQKHCPKNWAGKSR